MSCEISSMSVSELEALIDEANRRLHQLTVVEETKKQIEVLNAQLLDAIGRHRGEDWMQPTGAHDAYPQGWTVTHNGRQWESLTPANVWEPGVSGWREVTPEGGGPAEWVQPTGAHDAYKKGDRVLFDGAVFESLIDANVWSPAVYPAGWRKIE